MLHLETVFDLGWAQPRRFASSILHHGEVKPGEETTAPHNPFIDK